MNVFVVISTMGLAAFTLVAVAVNSEGIRRTVLVLATAGGALLSVNREYGRWAWLMYAILAVSIPAAVAVFMRDLRPRIVKNRRSQVVFVAEGRETPSSWEWRETAVLVVWLGATVAVSILSSGASPPIRVIFGVAAPLALLLFVFFLLGRRGDPEGHESDSAKPKA